ncbi:MAG TPA: hypothetical protein VFI96_01055 [Longimicrobiaceae bacterium]|nr:hypothetical protein [Longimicrobiaceae bacterium]
MPGIPIDFTALAALWCASAALMVAVFALAARFAVVPVIDALARYRLAARGMTRDQTQE